MDFAYINPEDLVLHQPVPPVPQTPQPTTSDQKSNQSNNNITDNKPSSSSSSFFGNFFTNIVVSLVGAIVLVLLLMATHSPLLQPSVTGLNPMLTRIVLGTTRDPTNDRLFEIFLIAFVGCLGVSMIVN